MPDYDVNWLAVVAATVAAQLLGFLWYGPVFGKMWLEGVGKSKEQVGSPGAGYVVAILASFVANLTIALVLNLVDSPGLPEGLAWGIIIGIGFVATSSLTTAAFDERKPVITWLFIGFQVLSYAVAGAILGAWR